MLELHGNIWCNSAVLVWPDSDMNSKFLSIPSFLGQAVETANSQPFCKRVYEFSYKCSLNGGFNISQFHCYLAEFSNLT